MFFGLARETEDVVPIRSTSSQAFCLMIDYIYGKDIIWCNKDIILILEVVNLAEMYLLDDLMEKVKLALDSFPLSKDTLMYVASAAWMFKQFEDISNNLFGRCAIF